MKETYRISNTANTSEKITQTATVTFVKADTPVTTPVSGQPVMTTVPVTTPTPSKTAAGTAIPTSVPVPKKTTYSPLPEWIALVGIVVAGLFIQAKNR
jgi:hypothetical protein